MAPWQNRLPTIAQDVCVEPPAVAASDETAIEDTLCSMTLVANSKFWVPPYYESFRWIGSGSFGVVAACWDAERKAKSAIKRIKPMAEHPEDARHVLREIRLMRMLGDHPNIAAIHAMWVPGATMRTAAKPDSKDGKLEEPRVHDELYLVMDLFDTDLSQILKSTHPLTAEHHRFMMFQLMRGLEHIHANGIIHRDVKPANLLVTRDCNLCITDFGLSRASTTAVPLAASHGGGGSGCGRSSEGDGIEVERAAMGGERGALMTKHVVTRWYRAPELMISPTGRYSCAIDMWSAGCVLAEMLRRKPLFPGKHFMQQLWLIFGLLGAPADSEVAHITSQEALRFLEQVAGLTGRPFDEFFSSANGDLDTLDLLRGLLVFNCDRRLSAARVLKHKYLSKLEYLAKAAGTPPPALPTTFSDFESKDLDLATMRKLIYAEATNFARAKAAEECKSSSDDGGGATADNDDGRLELDGEALDQSKKGAGANKRRNRSASLQEIPRARELTTTTANYGRAAVANDGGSHSGSAQRSGAPRLSHDGVEALAGRIRPGRYIRASHDGQIRTSDGGDEGGGVRKVTVGGVTFAPPGGDPSASATLSAGNSRSRIGLTPDRELGDGEQMGSGGNSNSQRGGRRHDRHSFDQPAVLERRMDQAAQQQAQRSRARNSDPLSEHVRAEAETVRSAGELMHGGNSNTAPDSSHIDADANANGNAHGNSSGNVNDGATHKETLGGELPTKLPQLSPSTTAATAGVSIGSIGSGSAVVRTSGLGSISSAELAQLDARGAKPSQAGGSFPASGTSALQPKTVPPIKLPPKRVAPGPDKHVPSDPEREAGGSEDEEEEETLDDECSAFGKTKSPHRERV